MSESTDPYTYPGTNVLRNLRDIQDPEILARFEAESSTWRIAQLIHASLKGRFDVAHFKAIHKHVFQDVYPWAGEFRTVNISKDDHLFAVFAFVEPALEELLQMLAGEDYLARSKTARFAARAGFYLGEINAIHPFREGNGRTQREFIRELGLQTGFAIDWSKISRDEMTAASRESAVRGDSSWMGGLILACLQ